MKNFLLKKMALPTIVLIWAASYYAEVIQLSEKNYRLIKPVFWVMVLLYVINGVTDFLEWKKSGEKEQKPAEAEAKIDRRQLGKVILIIAAMVIYVAALGTVGFLITTFVFVGAVLFLMGERKWYKLVGIPLLLTIFLYVVFGNLLAIRLPAGLLKI